MISADTFTLPMRELVLHGIEALKNHDLTGVQGVDAALHAAFAHAVERRAPSVGEGLLEALLHITESLETREISESSNLRDYLIRWEHLTELLAALYESDQLESRTEYLLESEEADQLVKVIENAGSAGIAEVNLMAAVTIAPRVVSKLLSDLEDCDIVEHQEFGGVSCLRLGLTGQLLIRARPRTSEPTDGLHTPGTPVLLAPTAHQLSEAYDFLTAVAGKLDHFPEKRGELFQSLLRWALPDAVGGDDLSINVIRLAHDRRWPDWTIPRLPSLFECIDRSRHHFLMWRLPRVFVGTAGLALTEIDTWCNGNIVIVSVSDHDQAVIERVAQIYEEKRCTVPFFDDLTALDFESKLEAERQFPHITGFAEARRPEIRAFMAGQGMK